MLQLRQAGMAVGRRNRRRLILGLFSRAYSQSKLNTQLFTCHSTDSNSSRISEYQRTIGNLAVGRDTRVMFQGFTG